MRYVALAATLCLAALFTTPLSAQTLPAPAQGSSGASTPQSAPQPQTSSMPTPSDGREFGRHVSGMAPEHPLEHGGAMFGECVSGLATTGDCPHHDEEEDE